MTDIELIKSKIDIVEFISEYIQVKRVGRNFKALCPFHSEKTPSFYISAERQSWHCFGACGEGGDVISFLEKWENIEFIEALRILAKQAGVTLSQSFSSSDESALKDKLYEINHLASEFYHYLLTSHRLGAIAMEYLKKRKIRPEIIKTFSLGYAPDSWESLLRYLSKKGYEKNDIFTAGLLVKSGSGSYYDRFRKRLIFTLKDHRGNIVGFSGRKLGSGEEKDLPADRQEAKYINTPETPIYHKGETLYGLDIVKESIKKEKEAVVVEGEFDFLSSFQSGLTNVVAIKGSALTEGQILLLKRFTENLSLALDSDFAGNEAAKRGIESADNAGMMVKVVRLPIGKDPAECVEKDPYLWKKAVAEAIPIYDFIIENAFEKYKGSDAADKKKIGSEVVPFLAKITNPIVFSHYVRNLAKRLGVSEESIETSVAQFQKKKVRDNFVQSAPAPKIQGSLPEDYLLSLIVQSNNPIESLETVLETLTLDDLTEPAIKNILERLRSYGKNNRKYKVEEFGKLLTAEILPAFDKAYLTDLSLVLSQKQELPKELIKIAREIKKRSLRRRINDLSTKMKRQEEEKDDKDDKDTSSSNEELRSILEKINELNKAS